MITQPDIYSNDVKKSIFTENWLFQMYYDNESAFNGFSYKNTIVDSINYNGFVINEPTIRHSIDLDKSVSRSGNISVTMANQKFKGVDLSREFINGSRKYLNRKLKVYSQLNDESSLSNCLLIFTGKLSDVSHDHESITLNFIVIKPFDNIIIPQNQGINDVYVPLIYGEYNTSVADDKEQFPAVATHTVAGGDRYFVYEADNDAQLNVFNHIMWYYDRSADRLFPLVDNETDNNIIVDNFETIDGKTYVYAPKEFTKRFDSKCKSIETTPIQYTQANIGTVQGVFTNTGNEMIGDVNVFPDETEFLQFQLSYSHSDNINVPNLFTNADVGKIKLNIPHDHVLVNPTFTVRYKAYVGNNNSSGLLNQVEDFRVFISNEDGSNKRIFFNAQTNQNIQTETTNGFDMAWFNDNLQGSDYYLWFEISNRGFTGAIDHSWIVQIFDLKLTGFTKIDYTDTQAGINATNSIDKIYLGIDGVHSVYSGGNNTPKLMHQVHRDLLARFTDYNPTSIDGFDDLDTIRFFFTGRFWFDKRQKLSAILERIQYEGGFIFTFENETGRYITLRTSISSNDISAVLNNNDISKIKYILLPQSSIITKRKLNYHKKLHGDGYYFTKTVENVSTRDDFVEISGNVSKEKIEEVNLDYLVKFNSSSSGNAPISSFDDPSFLPIDNLSFADVYNQINGDLRYIVNFTLVNSKYFNLECGDFIQFENLPSIPFNFNTGNIIYIIIEIARKRHEMTIKARLARIQ